MAESDRTIVLKLAEDLLETIRGLSAWAEADERRGGTTELPIPATFVLDRRGIIQLAFVEEVSFAIIQGCTGEDVPWSIVSFKTGMSLI